jgi:Cellulase (glycosyl hydrolase family 5)
MRPSVYLGPNPDGWFCVVPNCAGGGDPVVRITTEMRLMAQLGVRLVRIEFPWPLLEPQAQHYHWARADAVVNAANRDGIQLQPVLVYTPGWAGPTMTQAPSDPSTWTSFLSHVVTRYKHSIHYWELWNEPDGGGYWLDGTPAYVQAILQPGYAAVKAADPTARVLLGAPYFADPTYLEAIYTNGGGSSFDIAGFHEYANVLNAQAVQHDVDTIQQILTAHHQGRKPIWIGEYGYNEPTASPTDPEHLIAIKTVLQAVTGYREALWYTLRDDDAMTCCPPRTVKSAHWGLVQRDDLTLKQGYKTMRQILKIVG